MTEKENKNLERLYKMPFRNIYECYKEKIIRKNGSVNDLNVIISWLTGYSIDDVININDSNDDVKMFFVNAPHINENAKFITGMICGHRVENIEDALLQNIRRLDKLVDELANGKSMDKILRK